MAGESQKEPTSGAPDPTVLTTEQMLLAVKNLEKLVEAWRDTDQGRCTEQFNSIKTQLELIERQRVEQKKDTKDAVDAALSAAKEAVREQTTASQLATNKTETSFAEQLSRQETTFTVALAGQSREISDLKERVVTIESIRQGGHEVRSDQRLNIGAVVGVVSVVLTVLVAAVTIILATR